MIISIDIGTSYSSICYRNEQGEAQPIDIATGGGFGDKYSLPTAVCVENSGNVLVGQAAMAARKITPGNFCMEFKRDLGSSIPMLLGDKQFLPQDLYTQLLLHMKKCCRNISDESFEQISITYPVAYSEKKRKLIVLAANKAGLFDVQLVDEPSAAAMAYYAKGLLKEGEAVLIYDFGGGTFDVSVVRYAQGAFQVLKTGGLEHCGGSDIDYLIFEDMMEKSYETLGEEVMGMLTKNTLHQQKFQTQLSEEAIKGKCQLSTATTFTTYLAAGFDGFSYTMSRDTLNYKIASLIDHSIQECHRVLKLAGLTVTDLSAVFLVGGSSRIPLVQEMVQTFAKNVPVRSVVDLELAVAQGALCTAPLKGPEDWYQEGEDYYNGANGKNIDFSKAVLCYQKAAEQAYCEAQFNLARMYSKGEGCVQNDSEAARWYTLAATVGCCPKAQNNLGILSLKGKGIPQDDTMAVQWFEKAAEQGHAEAQYNLAKMLEQGRGVAKNQERALYFYEKATEQGDEEAKEAIERLLIGEETESSGTDTCSITGNTLTRYAGDSACVRLPREIQIIGNGAFENCQAIQEIILPEGLKSIGSAAFKNCTNLTSIVIPEKVTVLAAELFKNCKKLARVTLHHQITTIEQEAFRECEALQKLVLPQNVVSLGDSVFYACRNLSEIDLPDGLKTLDACAFEDCRNLKKITIPAGITTLGGGLFQGCSQLEEMSFPDSLISVNMERMFYRCASLTNVKLSVQTKVIGIAAFEKCGKITDIKIPDCVHHIGNNAFADCVNLTQIQLSDHVTSIVDGAFQNCKKLESVVLPKTIEEMGWNVFKNCESLETVALPEGIESIGGGSLAGAFSGCSRLKTVLLPNTLTTIETGMFQAHQQYPAVFAECKCLEELVIPDSVTRIAARAFNKATIQKIILSKSLTTIENDTFLGCGNLTNVQMFENVIKIGSSAFTGCSQLRNIVLPSSVTSIGHHAFSKCSSLKEIEIPSAVTRMEGATFYCCSQLTKVILPPALESIEGKVWGAFAGCGQLQELQLPDGISRIEGAAFSESPKLVLKCSRNSTTAQTIDDIKKSLFKGSLKNITIICTS